MINILSISNGGLKIIWDSSKIAFDQGVNDMRKPGSSGPTTNQLFSELPSQVGGGQDSGYL